MNESRLKGNFTGGFVLYGYKVKDHKIIIDKERAEVVRYIFNQYMLGVYVPEIIKALIQRNIFFHNNRPFKATTIYNMLSNEKYFGVYRINDQVYQNIYPAIVPAEVFEAVRKKCLHNKRGKRSTETTYLLRYKLKCGYCGMPVN